MSLKASISGIRGIVGESLTPDILLNYLSAYTKIIKPGKILIGRDSRVTGKMISGFVESVLNSLGFDVVDLGIVPTPVVLYGVAEGNYSGGIIITASHNPAEWNALKLVNSKGKFISPEEFNKLTEFYNINKKTFCKYDQIGHSIKNNEIPVMHRKKIEDFINMDLIKSKNLKVALDAVNGAGGPLTVQFLNNCNCEITAFNTEPTGIFAHPPEPTPANLSTFSKLIKETKVDAGFALDPDADRLVLSDENGNILSEELTLALCIKHYLTHYEKTDIVLNLSTSKVSEDVALEKGVKVYREPTGEINVTEKMEKTGSLFGGEGNGGIISYKLNKCRDALVGIAFILEMLSMTGKKMSELVRELPQYILIKEKYDALDIDFEKVEKLLFDEFKNEKIDKRDGIRIDYKDKWVLVRKSNTEPIIRIFAEAKTLDEAKNLIKKTKDLIGLKNS